ncbi:hypothetical protein [Aeromonas veronii]|uniref:hypothetical protein n=1 Tax=Aeromonas veronii TaxID=654 RepID=UPI001F437210|nr:hypothetical protein [Aeromonas veronii]MCF5915366.1 hypothetical protein [Aeromonas veronii]
MFFDIKKCVRLKGTDRPCMRIENSSSDGNITCSWWDKVEGLKKDVFAFSSLEECDQEDCDQDVFLTKDDVDE